MCILLAVLCTFLGDAIAVCSAVSVNAPVDFAPIDQHSTTISVCDV